VVPCLGAWGAYTGVLIGLLLLGVMRLLSERHLFRSPESRNYRKGRHAMKSRMSDNTHRQDNKSRTFRQFLLETLWTYGAGVMAAHWPP